MITLNSPSSSNSVKFNQARKKLEALSDKKLLSDLQRVNQKERRLNVLVLLYLSELESRKLYLPLGYSSLFDFCTLYLRYTRATAARRIRSARAVARYPVALEMLISGEINITTLSMISDILDKNNHQEVLSSIRGKSVREVELLVSRHRPLRVSRDMIRPVCVMRKIEEPVSCCGGSRAETNTGATANDERRNSNKISSSAETRSGAGRPQEKIIFEQRLKLGFTVSPEFITKFNKIKSLLSGKYPEGLDFETVFNIIMNEYLKKHDPEKRSERRTKKAVNRDKNPKQRLEKHRTQKTKQAAKRDRTIKNNSINQIREQRSNSRHIPPAIRDQVYTRDKGRCTFIGANGKRCGSTWDLEIDHVVPFARGGDNSPGNLRLLCRRHNIYHAERAYGKDFMESYK